MLKEILANIKNKNPLSFVEKGFFEKSANRKWKIVYLKSISNKPKNVKGPICKILVL